MIVLNAIRTLVVWCIALHLITSQNGVEAQETNQGNANPSVESAGSNPTNSDAKDDSQGESGRANTENLDSGSNDFFERRVRPILVEHCYECHSGDAKRLEANLRVDHIEFLHQGGDSGSAIDSENPKESLLLQAVRFENFEMPPNGKLPADDIAVLESWIEKGAYWPSEPVPQQGKKEETFNLQQRVREHWAWQPIRRQLPTIANLTLGRASGSDEENQTYAPKSQTIAESGQATSGGASDTNRPSSIIDAWIQKSLTEAQLTPAPEADRSTLIRRVYLDLLGLPPTDDQLVRWTQSTDIDWYNQLLDEVLADPQFGVRFGRHWLDLVRYAQSRGHEFDEDIPAAEQYRDYIVRAFNADVPYDQLLREHLAGDLLKEPRRNPSTRWNESLVATGFWHLGEWVHSPVDIRKDETDRFDNMVDVFSKTFLGLTVACARCHDHKFDAISTADYYSLFGYLRSSHYTLYRFQTDEAEKEASERLAALREKHRQEASNLFHKLLESKSPEDWNAVSFPEDTFGSQAGIHTEQSPELLVDFTRPQTVPFRANGYGFGSQLNDSGWNGAMLSPLPTQKNADGKTIPNIQWTGAPRLSADAPWLTIENQVTRTNTSNRHSQVDQAGKTFLTPWFTITQPHLHFLVRGNVRIFTAIDSYRLVLGPLHGEVLLESKSDRPDQWRWVTSHNLSRYIGKRAHIEFSPMDAYGCEILQVANSIPAPNQGTPQKDAIQSVYELITSTSKIAQKPLTAPNSQDTGIREEAFSELTQTPPLESAKNPLLGNSMIQTSRTVEWMLQWILQSPESLQFSPIVKDFRASIEAWNNAEQELQRTIPKTSQVALGMIDGAGQDDYLLLRGNSDRPTNLVARNNLEAFRTTTEHPTSTASIQQASVNSSQHIDSNSGSGRLELAESLLQDSNPLVARVIVNRLWHHLLGRGIVATTDDFGVQGRRPSHPELLDELSIQMRENQWSIKRLIREICSTHVYRQISSPGGFSAQDPNNELLAFANTKKLEGEIVRDGLFQVAGQLNSRINNGTPKVYLSEFLTGRGRPGQSGPLHGDGRRSLFLEIRRNFLNPMLTAFDMPTPFSSMGRRNVSNVPAQALTLLNDPLVHWLADAWAKQIAADNATPQQKIERMYRQARGRQPTTKELELAAQFLSLSSIEDSQHPISVDDWKDFAHVLLNSKELQFNF